ncbi:hypothetical protein [Vreelandella alkaliphila]|uniref:NACHT domain-containing protein n=1 Tax=Vreelandella alkaliphila TaxID=272774 RepID=A0ABX4HIZ5_9GAMM|nr:hypothetical protein [Halomonas humidisoli]PAU72431.1 hypothetical protein CK497_04695 [Halomonas humidisoli]
MIEPFITHVENLRNALLNLKPTGEDGFEGLIGEVLEGITGIPFRLASSGYQRGTDGKAAFEGAVAFEGKLYTNKLPRADVLSKIPDLVRHNDHADLVWVLGATCEVPSQLADDLRADGAQQGISVLILDWTPSDFPRLAVALAIAGIKTKAFLKANLDNQGLSVALAALDAIRSDARFPYQEETTRRSLDASGMATAMAENANAIWFEKTVSQKAVARIELGQPLAPRDQAVTVLARNDLVIKLGTYLSNMDENNIVCVHGEEGCGKSWIVLQTWLAQSDKPLLVFLTPDDFSEIATQDDIETLLIAKLVAQTGDVKSDESTIRWRRRLKAWAADDKPSRLHFVFVIDGINQRPDRTWGRIVSIVATYVNQRGGRIILTARTHYFKTRVRKALTYPVKEVVVPKWDADERDSILRKHLVPLNKLNPSVAEFLRNPRILSIAIEVFGDDVAIFEELSIERLLFEHIMAGIKEDFGDDPIEFVAHLRGQAKELLMRATSQVKDDLRIFDSEIPAVAEGRFYSAVHGEPQKYELRDEGLILALGFSIIENLRKAKRNNRSLDDALKVVLEPIEALDKTAEAVKSAIIVCAADDDEYSPEIAQALIKGFAELQNPPPDSLDVLVSLARERPLDIAKAARNLCLHSSHQPNFDWIQAALVQAAESSAVWDSVAQEVRDWLRAYSLAVERRMHCHVRRDPQDKVKQEREKLQAEMNDKLAALSPAEKTRQSRLIKKEGDLDALSGLALILLAGKRLAPFANELTDWCFANALNGSYQAPSKSFLDLISLNLCDWSEARSALLQSCKDLTTDSISKTGKWALLRILRATGDSGDDQEASILYKELTQDRQMPPGPFPTKEKIEPCDPLATPPANLDNIVQRYQSLDITALRQSMGQAHQDLVFNDSRPVVARFALEVATAKHRKFAKDVVKRTGISLRQGLLELREHGALVTANQAWALAEKWENAQRANDNQGLPNDDSVLLQYELLIAFPFLDCSEQIEILLATTEDQPLLLELIDETKTPDPQVLDRFLKENLAEGTECYRQHLLLEIAAATGAELSTKMCDFTRSSITSIEGRLRSSALGLAVHSGHPDLIRAVAESDWKYVLYEGKDNFENWYGSLALLEAAGAGLTDESMVIDRISPSLYGRAATVLKKTAVQQIAQRIDASIHCAVGLPIELVTPEIELEAEYIFSKDPILFSVSERETPSENIEDFFRRLSESDHEFRDRQKHNKDSFVAFREELTAAKAHIILDHLTHEDFAALAVIDPEIIIKWGDLFMEINDTKLPVVHNLILLVASAIADTNPEKSVLLFERTAHSRPLVRFTFGKSGVDLGSISVWKGGKSLSFDTLRRKRLDSAATDQAIAIEVLSALQCNQGSFLDAYIDEKIAQPEPAQIARGLMVAGFCDKSPRNERILMEFKDTEGLPGKAYEAALTAYRHNSWARHWFQIMCKTNNPATFWQAGVLFTQCVDGRFDMWRDSFTRDSGPIVAFGTSLKNPLNRRYGKLAKERQKRLFGQDAPSAIFIHSTDQ